MARGLNDAEGYLKRTEGLALSALPISEIVAAVPEHHDGVMVALAPDDPEKFAVNGADALPADDLHVTLCFLGKVQDLSSSDQTDILSRTQNIVDAVGQPFSSSVDGVVVMGKNNDGVPATALLIQSDEIVALYEVLSEALGYESNFPTFIPHMTAGYGTPVEDVQHIVGQPINFSNVIVKFGDVRHTIPLSSPVTAASPGANVLEHVVDSLGRTWNEGLHPRDGHGLFLKKEGAVSGKMQVQTPGGGSKIVDTRRATVRGFRTVGNDVWVMAEIKNPDGSTSEGFAKATDVRAVAPVKARLDISDNAYRDRVTQIRQTTAVADNPLPAKVV